MGDGGGDFFSGAGTPHGGDGDEALDLRGHVGAEVDDAGGDGVDGDLGGEGFGQGAGHVDDAGFGGAVGYVAGPGADAAERADVDDAASSAFEHESGGGLAGEEHGFEVDVVDAVPVFFGQFENVHLLVAGGVVDQAVEASVGGLDFAVEALDFGDLGEVGLKEFASAFLGGLAGVGFGGVVVDSDLCAFSGETKGDGAAYAAGGAGDEDDLVG